MTFLALLRHAETDWSMARRLQGRTDVPLNDAGRRALAGRRVPAACHAMQAVSSPLLRCTQTAHCLGLSAVVLEPRLTEMSWGAWEGCTLAALRASLGVPMLDNEAKGLDFRPDGGESPREVLQRVQPWLAELGHARRHTLAISHRGVIRAVFALAMAWDMRGKPPAKLDWSCLQLFRLDALGHPQVQQLNLPLDAPLQALGHGAVG
jgi:broad specificity phosphatase PhoE